MIYLGKNGQWYVKRQDKGPAGPFKYWNDAFKYAVRKGIL